MSNNSNTNIYARMPNGVLDAFKDRVLFGRAYGEIYMDGIIESKEKVLFHGPATIVYSPNGKKTVVKCSPDDTFNPRYGYLLAKFIESSGLSHRKAEARLKEVEGQYKESSSKLLARTILERVKNNRPKIN